MQRRTVFGLLNISKPSGRTSRDVVNRVARLVRPAKAGHAGTLDPLASGVLIVCVGPATRLVPFIQARPKVYRSTFRLGQSSNTDDVCGEIIRRPVESPPSRHLVRAALERFTGRIQQVPPQFSAVQIGGQRAYKMARRRQRFELPAKTVHIHRIDLRSYQYPELELDIECGGGTYIRSIARDLGEELGCGGLLSELERTRIGPWSVQEAVSADEVDEDNLQRFLLPASTALDELPRYECTADDLARLRNGRSIRPAQKPGEWSDGSRVALIDAEGELAGLAELSGVALQPRQVYLTRVT